MYKDLVESLRDCMNVNVVTNDKGIIQVSPEFWEELVDLLRESANTIERLERSTVDVDKAMEFIRDYSFKDDEEVYTNGSQLVSVFRIKQALVDKAYNGFFESVEGI